MFIFRSAVFFWGGGSVWLATYVFLEFAYENTCSID